MFLTDREATRAGAVADLSGPAEWFSVSTAVQAGKRLHIPTLVAASDADSIDTHKLRKAVHLAPPKAKRYVPVESGHGWDMLSKYVGGTWAWTRLARTVAGWIKGAYE